MERSRGVQEAIDIVATGVAALPGEAWGDWMVGVLDCLEGRAAEQGLEGEFDVVLGRLQNYLEDRMLQQVFWDDSLRPAD